jgi:hypothetical protein
MPSTPQQLQARARVEGLIALAAPALDLLLSFGDRVSRIVAPEDDYVPVRAAADKLELGRSSQPNAESD